MKVDSQNNHRLFMAIELTDEARSRFALLQDELRKKLPPGALRWVRPENLHLTLHFIGEVSSASIPSLHEALQAAAGGQDSFELRARGTGCFPDHRRPRVIWAGFEPSAEARELQKNLARQLVSRSFEVETRPYTPHLTLAYLEKRLPAKLAGQAGAMLTEMDPGPIANFPADESALVESVLTPSGPVYSRLSAASLGSPAG